MPHRKFDKLLKPWVGGASWPAKARHNHTHHTQHTQPHTTTLTTHNRHNHTQPHTGDRYPCTFLFPKSVNIAARHPSCCCCCRYSSSSCCHHFHCYCCSCCRCSLAPPPPSPSAPSSASRRPRPAPRPPRRPRLPRRGAALCPTSPHRADPVPPQPGRPFCWEGPQGCPPHPTHPLLDQRGVGLDHPPFRQASLGPPQTVNFSFRPLSQFFVIFGSFFYFIFCPRWQKWHFWPTLEGCHLWDFAGSPPALDRSLAAQNFFESGGCCDLVVLFCLEMHSNAISISGKDHQALPFVG